MRSSVSCNAIELEALLECIEISSSRISRLCSLITFFSLDDCIIMSAVLRVYSKKALGYKWWWDGLICVETYLWSLVKRLEIVNYYLGLLGHFFLLSDSLLLSVSFNYAHYEDYKRYYNEEKGYEYNGELEVSYESFSTLDINYLDILFRILLLSNLVVKKCIQIFFWHFRSSCFKLSHDFKWRVKSLVRSQNFDIDEHWIFKSQLYLILFLLAINQLLVPRHIFLNRCYFNLGAIRCILDP